MMATSPDIVTINCNTYQTWYHQSVVQCLSIRSDPKMIFTLLAIILALVFLWRKWVYGYWKRHNVPCPEPTFPVGNLGSVFTMKRHMGEVLQDWYKCVKLYWHQTISSGCDQK